LQAREHDRRLHLRARDRERVRAAVQRRVLDAERRRPSPGSLDDAAPMRASGSITRRMGRRSSDASPTSGS
jgi:hypothetical protein